jgi:hypothetical protein
MEHGLMIATSGWIWILVLGKAVNLAADELAVRYLIRIKSKVRDEFRDDYDADRGGWGQSRNEYPDRVKKHREL